MSQSIDAKIILDSINSRTGKRITTFQISIWKVLLQELNTHRMLSKSAASSRAIPTKKMRAMARSNPYIPVHWGLNGRGMQANGELTGWKRRLAVFIWRLAAKFACFFHWLLECCGLHKQVCNRVLEPWLRAQVVITATDFDNFFKLRAHPDAQPDFQLVAHKMKKLYEESTPTEISPGQWHIPYMRDEEHNLPLIEKIRISAARCARTSYFFHDGKLSSYEKDLDLCKKLVGSEPRHSNPFEHQAVATPNVKDSSGNFRGGWVQHREFIDNHNPTYTF